MLSSRSLGAHKRKCARINSLEDILLWTRDSCCFVCSFVCSYICCCYPLFTPIPWNAFLFISANAGFFVYRHLCPVYSDSVLSIIDLFVYKVNSHSTSFRINYFSLSVGLFFFFSISFAFGFPNTNQIDLLLVLFVHY